MPDGVNRADNRLRYPENEVAVVRLHYDFLLWLLPHVAGFSRQHRFTLGDRIEALGIEVLRGGSWNNNTPDNATGRAP